MNSKIELNSDCDELIVENRERIKIARKLLDSIEVK